MSDIKDLQHCLENFQTSIKNQNYYQAHEDLEAWWYPRRKIKTYEVLFVKGLINASVCFELFKLGRIHHTKNVWKTYEKYKILYPLLDHEYKMILRDISLSLEQLAKEKGII